MSGPEPRKPLFIYGRLILVAGGLLLAGLIGLWLGRLSVPEYVPAAPEGMVSPSMAEAGKKTKKEPETYINPDAPPAFFQLGKDICGDVAREEVGMAAAAGLHQYIVSIPAPWEGAADLAGILATIQCVVSADPMAALVLRVDLNPPEAWLNAHPEERVLAGGKAQSYASTASGAWLNAAKESLQTLTTGIRSGTMAKRVAGYVLSAMEDGRWLQNGFDQSPAGVRGFQAWLRNRYVDEGALRSAWKNDQVRFDSVSVPEKSGGDHAAEVFYPLPEAQSVVDFLRYQSESAADAIGALAGALRECTKPETLILAPYGFSLELLNNDTGHFALGNLLESDVDGFISPVSYVERGLGGAGGMMGPINSAQYHGREWYIVDDTRTGIRRDPATGAVGRLKGIHPEDVYNVQRRNFALAMIHNLGIVWSDPESDGWLHDEEQWSKLGEMYKIYYQRLHVEEVSPPLPEPEAVPEAPQAESENTPPAESAADVATGPEEGAVPPIEESAKPVLPDLPPPPDYATGMMVVVDEGSRFYQQYDAPLNEVLLQKGRDAALRAGVPTQFSLLQDLLDDRTPPAPVYLFLNAFHLTQSERMRLHERLAHDQACAIWAYAPGYIDRDASVDNITATTKIQAKAFDGPAQTGSIFALAGRWLDEGEAFGTATELAPLFYIDDNDTDVLAKYQTSNRTSVAMRSLDTGWTSVFLADPNITPKLLRELLRILEQHVYFHESGREFLDVAHIGGGLLSVHAKGTGDRTVVLERYSDVQDLFDASAGWPQKDNFVLPMKTGDTRLLKLTPLYGAAARAQEEETAVR